jgi:hypothetical protein
MRLFSIASVGLFAALVTASAGCGGGGQYSFSHSYEPLGEEQPYMQRATELSYEEVRRTRPEAQQLVAWFGVVVAPPVIAADGTARLELSLRAHQERHLCSTGSSDSCRVTVSQREIGRFVANVRIRPEERSGQARVWTGSLLKVYGVASGEEDPALGPTLDVEWYRHWPTHYYVTTGAAGSMRR